MYFNAERMYRMCIRKKKYTSWGLAERIAKECDEKYNKIHRVYACPLCGFYHLTTKEKFEKMEKKNESK